MVARSTPISFSAQAHKGQEDLNREILVVNSVTVDYPGVRALDAVLLAFRTGEIHAIVGENGAGKSTMMKVLSGVIRPTSGTINLKGMQRQFTRPSDAIRAGIAMVHQELHLVGTLNVAENVLLGREPTRFLGVAVDHQRQHVVAGELLRQLGSDFDLSTLACDLSIAQQQFVEIAKCLASDARVLIFDEPTAVLGEVEANRLFAVMRRLRDEGRCVIFISHHLDEVISIADRITVLRDGKVVQAFSRNTSGIVQSEDGSIADEGRLAHAMVGHELSSIYPEKMYSTCSSSAIELANFGAKNKSHGISFSVAAGEILGIAGLVGSGRTETAEAIVGIRPCEGVLRVEGREIRFSNPRAAMRSGVAYVSEDRKNRGLHVTLSSICNMMLPSLDKVSRLGGIMIDSLTEQRMTKKWIDAFQIRCARPMQAISSLSGGNQQKFALARWLEARPKVLIIDEPTRGVDVGARGEIYRIIAQLAREGLACIVISSELPEVIGIAHRVIVMREGTIAGEISSERLALKDCQERIVRIASGLSEESVESK